MCHKHHGGVRPVVMRAKALLLLIEMSHSCTPHGIEFYDYGARDASNTARHSINFAQ
jgi:hypothetical protein